jgi:hypothetical protein
VGRYQVNLTVGEELRSAILFSAMRDGMNPSSKIRQILTQQLRRTIDSAEFQDHLAAVKERAQAIEMDGPADDK